MLAAVASQPHKLKVGSSNLPPATKFKKYMGEVMVNNGKIMTAAEAQTIRELVDLVNDCKIPREDVVSILPSKEGYIMVYYY